MRLDEQHHQEEVARDINNEIFEQVSKRHVVAQIIDTEKNKWVKQVNKDIEKHDNNKGKTKKTHVVSQGCWTDL